MQSETWKQRLRSFFRGRRVASIIGETEGTRFFERACGGLPFQRTDYILMRRAIKENNDAEELKPRYAIGTAALRLCAEKDASKLLPFQIAYEAEEMGASGGEAEIGKVLMRLNSILRRQIVLACHDESTGKLLGKAGTNARGMRWNQIGGVYTLPEYRGRGVASLMVHELVRLSAAEGKGSCLFVRPENAAARQVYAKISFEECGSFRVAARG